jgi:hypothetical protein
VKPKAFGESLMNYAAVLVQCAGPAWWKMDLGYRVVTMVHNDRDHSLHLWWHRERQLTEECHCLRVNRGHLARALNTLAVEIALGRMPAGLRIDAGKRGSLVFAAEGDETAIEVVGLDAAGLPLATGSLRELPVATGPFRA